MILSVMNDVFLTSWCAKGLKKNVWRRKAASRVEKDGKEGIGGGCHREGPVPRGSRCTEEKTAAKLWAKRLTAYHRLHLKRPPWGKSGKTAKQKYQKINLKNEKTKNEEIIGSENKAVKRWGWVVRNSRQEFGLLVTKQKQVQSGPAVTFA